MRQTIFVLVVAFALVSGTIAGTEAGEAYDFRRVSWGMSRAEVILSEDKLPLHDDFNEQEGALLYGRWTEGEPILDHLADNGIDFVLMEIIYRFYPRNRLSGAEMHLVHALPTHTDFDYTTFYQEVSSWLEGQYGKGQYQEIWEDGPKEGNHIAYIYLGELTRVTIWRTDRTGIVLIQKLVEAYGNKQIETHVIYVDRAFLDDN